MPLSETCLFASVNRLDDPLAVLTTGAPVPTFPVSNLANRSLSRPWRTLGTEFPNPAYRDLGVPRTWMEADLGAQRVVQLVAIQQHNLTQAATWQVQLSNAADFSTLLYDSGRVKAWPLITAFGSLPWGVFAWGGAVAKEDAVFFNINSFALLESPVTARYLRIVLFDFGNPDGFLQVARAYAGPIYQPSLGMELDWSVGWEDPSEATRSLGGSLSFDEREKYRVISFSLGHIPEQEALVNISTFLDRRRGTTGDLLFIPQPKKPGTWAHEAVYARQRRLDPLRMPNVDDRRHRGFELEELR